VSIHAYVLHVVFQKRQKSRVQIITICECAREEDNADITSYYDVENDISDTTLIQACESYEQQLTSGLTDNNDATENEWMNDDIDEDTLLKVCEAHDRQLTSGNIDDNDPDVEHNNRRQENGIDDNALAAAAGEIQRQLGRNTMLMYHCLH